MNSLFNSNFFASNRQRLREIVSVEGPIVIGANLLQQRSADTAFPFYQEPSFWYLTGIDDAAMVLVIEENDEYLVTPRLTYYQEAFDGTFNDDELRSRSGITTILSDRDGWQRLRLSLRNVQQAATLLPAPNFIVTYGMFANPQRRTLSRRLKAVNPKLELVDIKLALAGLRVVKQAPELEAIKQAITITSDSIAYIYKNLKNYKYEYEIEADITAHVLRSGAQDAWKPTVAAGMNAVTLHASITNTPLDKKDLVVVDVGSQVEHYCSDITRTLSLSGRPSARQQAVYDAVKAVQEYAFGLQQVGANIFDNERLVEHALGEQMQKLGLITDNTRENVRKYYKHACSHFLGLDPHDAGDYRQALQPGMVLTVEPGIYIPEEGIGVRLEDDVLITESGIEILSQQLPRVL